MYQHRDPSPYVHLTMKYRLVIFDFDGTLADTFPWFSAAINEVADRFGFRRVGPGEHDALRNLTAVEILRRLEVPLWNVPRIASHMRGLMSRDIGQIRAFNGVRPMVRELAGRGLSLGLVSSNSLANIRHILGTDAEFFTHLQLGVSLFGKSAQLRKILRTSKVPGHEVLYIGDETRDLEAARDAGVRFGAVAWGYTQIAALRSRGPDEVFLSVEEISERLA